MKERKRGKKEEREGGGKEERKGGRQGESDERRSVSCKP